MFFTFELGLSIATLTFSQILIGWESWVFWIIGLITVLQIVFVYLLPQYWTGRKLWAKQGLLVALGLAGMFATVLWTWTPEAVPLLLAILGQTIAHVVFA